MMRLLLTFVMFSASARADLRVYYDFESVAGTTVPNLAGVVGGAVYGAPQPDLIAGPPKGASPGTALWLDGVNDYVDLDIPANTLGMLDGDFAVSAWVMLGNNVAQSPVLGQGSNVVFWFGFRNLVPRFRTSALDLEGMTGILAEKFRWTHCVWVQSQGLMSLYLDGVRITQVVAGGNHINTVDPHIGEISGTTFFQGAIDEFAVFDAAITENQIRHLAAGGRADALPAAAPRYVTAPFGPGGTWNLYATHGLAPGQGVQGGWTGQLTNARVPNPLLPLDPRLGHLTWIESVGEHGFLRRLAGNFTQFWIGLSDNVAHGGTEGTFVWVGDASNSSPPPLTTTRWRAGQPDNAVRSGNTGQDAVSVGPQGDWFDWELGAGTQPMLNSRGSIVEWEVGAATPIPGAEVFTVLPQAPHGFPTPATTGAGWRIRQVVSPQPILATLNDAVAALLSYQGTITDQQVGNLSVINAAAHVAVHARAVVEIASPGTFTFSPVSTAPFALRVSGVTWQNPTGGLVLDPGDPTTVTGSGVGSVEAQLSSGLYEVDVVTFSGASGGLNLALTIGSLPGGALQLLAERPAPAPAQLAIQPTSPGVFLLAWPGTPGARYQIEESPDLGAFQDLGRPVVGTVGPSRIGIASPAAGRFFRLKY